VLYGQGEHLAEDHFGAPGRRRVDGGLTAQQPVEAADARLPDPQVSNGGQDRGPQAGGVPVDGLRRDAFLGGDLLDPQLGERPDAGLSADLVVFCVVRSRSLTFSARIAAGAVVSVASMSRAFRRSRGSGLARNRLVPSVSVQILPQVPMGGSGRATGSPDRVGVRVEPSFDLVALVPQGVADTDSERPLASAVPGVAGCSWAWPSHAATSSTVSRRSGGHPGGGRGVHRRRARSDPYGAMIGKRPHSRIFRHVGLVKPSQADLVSTAAR
jgi:hypothetical protein